MLYHDCDKNTWFYYIVLHIYKLIENAIRTNSATSIHPEFVEGLRMNMNFRSAVLLINSALEKFGTYCLV